MLLSVTVDFPDDVCKGPYDADRLDQMMSMIAATGAKRVHWIYYGEVVPGDPRQGNIFDAHWAIHGPRTIAALGEPLRAAVPVAKRHGLEIYVVLKPYNGGLSGSYPLGSREAGSTSRLRRIGGTLQQVIPFLEANPQMRLQRRPEPVEQGRAITELVLRKSDSGITRLRPEHLRLWVSEDNFRYRPLSLVPRGVIGVEPAPQTVHDYHGNILTRAGDPVRVVRLVGLDLREPYLVVTTVFTEGRGDFRNTPCAMIEARDRLGAVMHCVVATHAATWVQPRDFRSYGLEFDQGYGHMPITLDTPWQGADKDPWIPFSGEDEFAGHALLGNGASGGFVGLAPGRNEFLPAAPCEAYPSVRSLWLGWVKAMLDAGVDGVDLRVSAHGCLTDEPDAYGWNPPVLEAYAERYGAEPVDLRKLAGVRGDFYSEFVRDASRLVRGRGKKLQVHLHAEAFRERPVFGQQNGVPASIEFQWRRWLESGWVDSAYLRTSWFEAAEDPLGEATARSRLETVLQDPVVAEMHAVAARARVPVVLNRYIGRAAGLSEYLDDLERITRDGRFAGFDVYEFFDLAQSDESAGALVARHGRLSALRERWNALQRRDQGVR
jgi:hypothetical protein